MSRQLRLRRFFSNIEEGFNSGKIEQVIHIDFTLLSGLLILIGIGLIILYSASSEDIQVIIRQSIRLGAALLLMIVLAQISPDKLKRLSPWLYGIGLILLLCTLALGVVGKGAQRWLDLKVVRFQPSEIMKLAIPMVLAWYLSDRRLPPNFKQIILCGILIAIPVVVTAKQPDLGTALMLASSGGFVLFMAGISWRIIIFFALAGAACAPVLWLFMHNYQRQRVLTFLDPERDPLGAGYHIIQSKIAIGSGGMFGKGWLHGTQSQLDYLPEHATDFIFAVLGEEFGLIGAIVLLAAYLFIVFRGLYISSHAQNTFGRLLAGGLALTFLFSFFVNIGMVSGILPVVGIPLPLVSYGGTSMVTLLASFGLLMSIQTHRKLVSR